MCENEPDSEDDFEGYFLKPVNGYNIVDRIKDANDELFATPQPPSPSVLNRKVTFREVLEDYEPNNDDIVNVVTDPISPVPEGIIQNSQTEEAEVSIELGIFPKDNMSDSSDHEIEEICEEVDSLEVQDPISDCEKSSSCDLQPEIKQKIEVSCNIPMPNHDEKPLLTSISHSSEDSLPVIEGSAYVEEELALEKTKRIVEQDSESREEKQNRPRTPREKRSKNVSNMHYVNDVLKLRLNYKTCCEYKNSIDNLPRYSGYFSQYGLSKEQWERREKRYESKRRKFVEKSAKVAEAENKKMEDNERAFTNWLRNKMRYPINKTKNMFDFKPIKLKRRKKVNEINN